MKKASDLFIECLEEEGVEYIFGVPGEENLDFLDSLSRSTQIKLILTRHEQGAGFMAATYGRHTGKTGVCLATLGPGATNFVTAAAYAQLGVWTPDANGGGKVQSLKEANVGALSLARVATPYDLRDGSNETLGQIRSSGVFLQESGGVGSIQQVDLSV